jgi:hypothetical protein
LENLLLNIRKMRNDEIVGLAKNRFISEELQLALVDLPYRNGHTHLLENSGLTAKVRDLLWSDRINSGYTYKSTLIANGFYINDPEKYWELFRNYPSAWKRSPYRMLGSFVYHNTGRYWRDRNNLAQGAAHTPSELLNKIYDCFYCPKRKPQDESIVALASYYSTSHQLELFASHPNCPLELAIKISTCGHNRAEQEAFRKIVELSK